MYCVIEQYQLKFQIEQIVGFFVNFPRIYSIIICIIISHSRAKGYDLMIYPPHTHMYIQIA